MSPEDLEPGSRLRGLPVFPLPNVVFFPRTVLPLHVFEPRYLAMVADVMASDRLMGVVWLEPGWNEGVEGKPTLSPVFGVGEVVRQEAAEDGQINILVKGLARARLLEECDGLNGYRRVDAEILEEVEGASSGQIATVRQLFANILAAIEGADLSDASVLFEADLPTGLLLDAIATAAPLSSASKQSLLEHCTHAERADRLAALLVELGAELMEWGESDGD